VLREAQRRAAQYQSLPPERLFPNWLTTRWRAAYGEAGLAAFAEALLIGAPLDLTLREIDPGLVAELGATPVLADSVRLGERDRPVTELPGFAEGQWWVQDAAAALPARLLNLPEGARVLDLCAAPGGKTAQLIKAGFRVTALDNDAARLARLGENLARLGYSADLVQADAIDHTSNEPFDGVLLDAPCSATGTFRRHPEVVWLRNEADLAGRSALQQKISANAARLLKPGGVLVFCTCSLEPEEGENIAAWIATSLPELEPSALVETDLSGFSAALTADGCLRTHPAMIVPGEAGGTLDGFFAARFTKRFSPSS
jgi:16S rRNA (cytosine967-C5)-methyltransferase